MQNKFTFQATFNISLHCVSFAIKGSTEFVALFDAWHVFDERESPVFVINFSVQHVLCRFIVGMISIAGNFTIHTVYFKYWEIQVV